MARRVFGASDEQNRAAPEELVQPEASLEMAMARGELIHGRERSFDEALESAR